MKVREAIVAAAARLTGDTGRLDAELLMAHALGASREEMLLQRMDAEPPEAFESLVERRLAHEPVAYIVGRRAFWSVELEVGPGVLIPRPDSETLIEAAIHHFGDLGPVEVLDLGTGPGTLLLAALTHWRNASGLGVDISRRALDFAERNAARLGLDNRARFRLGDWAKGLIGPIDLILCNPPYVEAGANLMPDVAEWEPEAALYAGADGLETYRVLAPQVRSLLAPDGIACFEVGAGQASAVRLLFAAEGFTIESRNDLKGVERCLVITA